MRAAYYHPASPTQAEQIRTPMRQALSIAGIDVLDVVDRDYEGRGGTVEVDRQRHFAQRLLAEIRQGPGVDLWISEGISPETPDRLGPIVSSALTVPFVALEPDLESWADRQSNEAVQSVRQASHIVTTSSRTGRQLKELVSDPGSLTLLPPFVDVSALQAAHKVRELHRARLASKLQLPEASPWLLTDGAMERGDALQSYDSLALALSRLILLDWKLIVIGRGDAQSEAKNVMLRIPQDRIRYRDALSSGEFAALCVSCDLFVWPAIGSAPTASLLEAQAAGVPVIAGRKDSTSDRVVDGRTGRLTPMGNAESFANAVSFLLRQPDFLQSFSEEARETINVDHNINTAALTLAALLSELR